MKKAILASIAFLGCILAANYVTSWYGFVWVFGLTATAGTYFAGATFVLRDTIQDGVRSSRAGLRDWQVALPVFALIIAGAALSFLVSLPAIALASGLAFLFSETADLSVYTPLRDRGYLRAAVASNVVGAVVDTFLFLWIAGFPVSRSLAGQLVGKLAVTAVVILVVGALRWRRARRLAAHRRLADEVPA